MNSRNLVAASLTALLAGVGLTACGSGPATGPAKAAGPATVSAAPLAGRTAAPTAAAPGVTVATGSGGPKAPACAARDLRWALTRLTDAGTGTKDPANAELVAVNSGSHGCTMAGYPRLEFHLGKGPEAVAVGKGSPAPVTLAAGRKAVFALHYSEMNGKGPDSDSCNPSVTAEAGEVAAPGESTLARVQVLDQHGKPARITVCGDEVRMSPPVGR
ncbi:DUF4232 domain-containing protein [Kitasatospora sp. NPDC059571]|uniref:DUF4232 domain-containing protein n=1 Tax=Kitasatospora sp. NPDC059571 TaxID=3346871 RepID=UPI00368D0E30